MTARRTLVLSSAMSVLLGCAIGKPLPPVVTYMVEPPAAHSRTPHHPDVLRVGRVRVAPAFAGKALVYRRDDVQYVSDPYRELLAEPGAMLGSQIATWLDQAGLFATVMQPESIRTARYVLDATVVELYGDFRPGRHPAAVVAVQFALLDQAGPRPAVVHECTIARRIDLAQASPDDLVRGYGQALAAILTQLVSELAADQTS